jgi:hypothetical protein
MPYSPVPSAAPMSMQENTSPGIHMSRELYDLAGFGKDQTVGCVNLH